MYSGILVINIEESHENEIIYFDMFSYPFIVGIAILNFEGNPTALNLRASMKNPKYFDFTFMTSVIIVTLTTCTVSAISYIAFGNEVEDIILINLPTNHLTTIVRITY